MAARTKLTPFARLFIFLIIFLPLAYFGAAYYNGEDPMQAIKGLFQKEQTGSGNHNSSQDTYQGSSELERLRDENAQLKRRVGELEAELKQLRDDGNSTSGRRPWGNNNN